MKVPKSFQAAAPLLRARPVGRVSLAVKEQALSFAGKVAALDATRPVAGDVQLGLYLNLKREKVVVSAQILEKWGVSLDQALEIGTTNWRGLETPVVRVESTFVMEHEGLAATLLADPRQAYAIVGAQPIILVASDSDAVLARADDAKGVALAARIAETMLQRSQVTVTANALIATERGWEPFAWPASASEFSVPLLRRFDAIQYRDLRDVLQAAFDVSRSNLYFAECVLAKSNTGEVITYASVTENIETVVPRVDQLVLVSLSGSVRRVDFNAMQQAGKLSRLGSIEPPVFLVAPA